MDTISRFMSEDHQLCDELFSSAEASVDEEDWDAAARRTRAYVDTMVKHFAMEEEVLFPAFEESTGEAGGPTAVMRGEHEQMRDLFLGLEEALERRDKDAYLGVSETLLIMMQQHNLKEQQILYPLSDDLLGGDVDDVMDRMRAIQGTG